MIPIKDAKMILEAELKAESDAYRLVDRLFCGRMKNDNKL